MNGDNHYEKIEIMAGPMYAGMFVVTNGNGMFENAKKYLKDNPINFEGAVLKNGVIGDIAEEEK